MSPKLIPLATFLLIRSLCVSAYTLQNVTVASTDPAIQYFSPCVDATAAACNGAWWKDTSNPNYYGGAAMVCGDPAPNFQNQEPYLAYKFTGSAFYVYEWLSTTTASQSLISGTNYHIVNFTLDAAQYTSTPLTSTPQLVNVWSVTGLDPTSEHTIGIQHFRLSNAQDSFIVLDHFVVTMAEGSLPGNKSLSTGAKAGIAIAVILLVAALFLAIVVRRGQVRRRRSKNRQLGGTAGTGAATSAVPGGVTLKWMGPSSEIEASERLAREGIDEEAKEKQPAEAAEETA